MKFDGKKRAEELQERLQEKVAVLLHKPSLLIIQVGDNAASNSFIKIKVKMADTLGIAYLHKKFEDTVSTEELVDYIQSSETESFTGVIVQLPLPHSIDSEKVLSIISKEKDIDVLGQMEKVFFENGAPLPPVVGALNEAISFFALDYTTTTFAVVGMGKLVGQPVYTLLKSKKAVVYSIDIDTPQEEKEKVLREADCIISGVGKPRFIQPEAISENAFLIDLGTSLEEGKIVGDFDEACYQKVKGYTPVPGGLGPITVVKLFENLVSFGD